MYKTSHSETVIVSDIRFHSCITLLAVLFSVTVLIYTLNCCPADLQTDVYSNGPRAVHTLKFLVIVARHGNRRSLITFPNDPYPVNDTNLWPYGLEELTTVGRFQMYNLGTKIRSLYNGFLKTEYSNKDFYASSTTIDRTLISAEAFLAGLYPPTSLQVRNKGIARQLIPVYSNLINKNLVQFTCPKFVQARNISIANYEEQYADKLSAINQYSSSYAGVNLSGQSGIFTVWDTLISEDTEGYILPEWTKKVYPEPLADLVGKLYIATVAETNTMTRLFVGPLLDEIIGIMKRKIDRSLVPDRQVYFYSEHDNSIVTLQAVLGIHKSSIIGLVKCGSAMIYELHHDPNTTKVSVQVLYIDGSSADLNPVPINIPVCSHPCDFEQVVRITKEYCNFAGYEKECQLD